MIEAYLGCILAFMTIIVILGLWNILTSMIDGCKIRKRPGTKALHKAFKVEGRPS